VPNFVESARTAAEILRFFEFSVFKMTAGAILNFRNFILFYFRNGQEGESVKVCSLSQCQILLKSLQSRPRYGNFSIFNMTAAAILCFLNFKLLTVGMVRGSNCISVPNFVEIARTAAEICKFQYYASVARKCLLTPFLRFFGHISPK